MKIVTQEEMRDLETRSVEAGVSLDSLMENAGLAVARWIRERLGGRLLTRRVLVLVGPGNNGADGLVAARHLSRWGANVTCYVCISRPDPDPKANLAAYAGARFVSAADDPGFAELERLARSAHVTLDAILGIGRARSLIPPISDETRIVRWASEESGSLVVALDVQSGLDADTGELDPNGLRGHIVLTLGVPKIGLYLQPLVDPSRDVVVIDIGIPSGLDDGVQTELITEELAASLLPERPITSNKGTYGRALIVGGSKNYVGAAYFSTAAAGRAGAGIVTLAAPRSIAEVVASSHADATYVPLVESEPGAPDPEVAGKQILQACERATALLIGPGLGQTPYIGAMLRRIIQGSLPQIPLILDADALNALSRMEGWWRQLRRPGILTPHPGEMARLLESTVAEVQNDRLKAALGAAKKFGYVMILKGACTIVANPDGRARVSPWANAALAKGGTGDVLAGAAAGFLAQGLPTFDAATLAVYAHGLAGDLVRKRLGETSATASDVLDELPRAIRSLESARQCARGRPVERLQS
ncbi:MAG: NAD(P)H-hydrate dehydratase [Chloroflexi bacterium]|nr:NAD(P)H-hydrate dehydratase [Chloroflexota bacterium]